MCGIVGVIPININGRDLDNQRIIEISLFLQNELLLETVSRGKDATGVVASFDKIRNGAEEDEPHWTILKQPVPAEEFIRNDGMDNRYSEQDPNANMVSFSRGMFHLGKKRDFNYLVGHCRAATQGTVYNPYNNHPIKVGNVIGVHNGNVKNDDVIFNIHKDEMTRLGDVDSEALIQLMAYHGNDEPMSKETLLWTAERMDGAMATIAFNALYPKTIGFMRNHERPLSLAYLRSLGIIILVSDDKFLAPVARLYDRMRLIWGARLPKQSLMEIKTVPGNVGGIIDVKQAYDYNTSIDELVQKFNIPNTIIAKYDPPKKTYTQGGATVWEPDKHKSTESFSTDDTDTDVQMAPKQETAKEIIQANQDFKDYTNYEDRSVEEVVVQVEVKDQVPDLDEDEDGDVEIKELMNAASASLLSLIQQDKNDATYNSLAPIEDMITITKTAKEHLELVRKSPVGNLITTEGQATNLVDYLYEIFYQEGYLAGALITNDLLIENIDNAELKSENALRDAKELREKNIADRIKYGKIMANSKWLCLFLLVMVNGVKLDGKNKLAFTSKMEKHLETAKEIFPDLDIKTLGKVLHDPKLVKEISDKISSWVKKA